jgi:hypothetical protein
MVLVSCFLLVHQASTSLAGELLTVRVHGDGQYGRQWPSEAPAIAERIFRNAGMRLLWIDCLGDPSDSACDRPAFGNEFIVRIRARPGDAGWSGAGESLRCGESHRPEGTPGHYVTVYHDCISATAGLLGIAEAVLGAHIIAHEIGHLLLPIGHAPAGIMRERLDGADWVQAANGTLAFKSSEVRHMLAELRRRRAATRDGT